jgi:hypothetical protein
VSILDTTQEGAARVLDSMRVGLISPALGLPAFAVPVGTYGCLRPGAQAPRFHEVCDGGSCRTNRRDRVGLSATRICPDQHCPAAGSLGHADQTV